MSTVSASASHEFEINSDNTLGSFEYREIPRCSIVLGSNTNFNFFVHSCSLIFFAISFAIKGGTALPICLNAALLPPSKKKLSGND